MIVGGNDVGKVKLPRAVTVVLGRTICLDSDSEVCKDYQLTQWTLWTL